MVLQCVPGSPYNGVMRLTILGCSGSVIGPDAACSSYLATKQGYRLLLDLGTGACGPLLRHVSPDQVDQVFISHAHADHYADLQPLAYHRDRLGAGRVPLIGPSNLPSAVSWLDQAYDFHPASPGTIETGPFTLRLLPVQHGTIETWGVRVDDSLCYTADSLPCAALDELAAGCEILLAEACWLHGAGTGPHLSGREAGELAARAGVRLLVLTHMRFWNDNEAILAEAQSFAGCPVVQAVPHLVVSSTRQ